MSLFCSFDKSTADSILHKLASRRLLAIFSPSLSGCSTRYEMRNHSQSNRDQSSARHTSLQNWVVNALVTAGQCRENNLQDRVPKAPNIAQRRSSRLGFGPQFNRTTVGHRYQHNNSCPQQLPELSTREELLALVDQYSSESLTDHLPVLGLPNLQQPEPGPHLSVSDDTKDFEWPPSRYVWPARGEEEKAVELLEQALKDNNLGPEKAYRLYRALPAPRVPYLRAKTRHKVLRTLGILERKDEQSMLRYLSVVDDMKVTGIPLTISEWNCATSFAGRYVGRTTDVEVEAGLRLWKEMEHVAGVRANCATFNILFDMATKAGKFKLAEMIYEEMERRGHSYNRFHHVSLIHYYGLRADGEGVRKAYKALIDAGEIVDTVVLNCVISSLLRAYEPQAAEQVYERMKRLHAARSGARMPPRDYQQRREVAKALVKMAKLAKQDPIRLKRFQNQSIIAPDVQTFSILIQYQAVKAGELHKVVMLLDEMRWFDLPLSGSIFLALFRGFAAHGGIRYSHWSEDRLESVWTAFLQAVDSQHGDLFIGKWIVMWALKAFAKCSNKSKTVEVWEVIKEKWMAQDEELSAVKGLLHSLVGTDEF